MNWAFKITILVICMVATCGCEGIIVHVPDPTPIPTPTPAPEITEEPTPDMNITEEEITDIPTPEPTTIVPTSTPTSRRTPRIVTTQAPVIPMNESQPYLTYADSDFTIDYPSNWTIQTATVAFVPSRLNYLNTFKTDSRQITFRGDSNVNFIVTVSDLVSPGFGKMGTDIGLCTDSISQRFPDVGGPSAMSYYTTKYTDKFHTPYVQFNVHLPDNAAAYPLSYTERDLMSYNHFYNFRFNTPDTLENYDEIKNHMLDSLKTEELTK